MPGRDLFMSIRLSVSKVRRLETLFLTLESHVRRPESHVRRPERRVRRPERPIFALEKRTETSPDTRDKRDSRTSVYAGTRDRAVRFSAAKC